MTPRTTRETDTTHAARETRRRRFCARAGGRRATPDVWIFTGFALWILAALIIWGASVILATPARAMDCLGVGDARLEIRSNGPVVVGGTFQFVVRGKPLARFALAADVGDGPTTFPGFGTLCLDFGPKVQILADGIQTGSDRLGPDGRAEVEVRLPARTQLRGRTFFAQGVILDDDAPNGIAITNLSRVFLDPSLREDFSSTTLRDTTATTAQWVGDGSCVGPVLHRTVDYTPLETQFNLPHPLVVPGDPFTPNGCRFQMRFRADQHGADVGDWITGMSWAPKSGFVFASTYGGMRMSLAPYVGLPNGPMSTRFNQNNAAPPTVVFQGDYRVPNATGRAWFPWPSFTTDYEVTDAPVLFEIDVPTGGSSFQLFRNRSILFFPPPHNRNLANSGAQDAINWPDLTEYWTRFRLTKDKTVAQSRFWDTNLSSPTYGSATVDAAAGGSSTLEVLFQGGTDTDGDGVPDALSEWLNETPALSGHRYIRFRIDFDADHLTGTMPSVRSLEIPVLAPEG